MKNFLTVLLLFIIQALAFSQEIDQDLICLNRECIMPTRASVNRTVYSINEATPMKSLGYLGGKFELLPTVEEKNRNCPDKISADLETRVHRYLEMGYFFGVGDYNIDYLKFNAIYSYKINPYFFLGLGTGLRYALQVKDALIPFFADFRANLNKNKLPVYLSLDVGYSLDVTSDFKTEGLYLLINPAAGVSFRISEKSEINVGIGYDFQKYKMSSDDHNVIPGSIINTTGVGINVGISF